MTHISSNGSPLFSFENGTFRYDPYPIGLATKLFPEDFYAELVQTWPPTELFKFMQYLGNKYSLSQVNHPREYHRYVGSHGAWRDLRRVVKSRAFIHQVLGMLFDRDIDLGLGGQWMRRGHPPLTFLDRLRVWRKTHALSARFEFSMLPAAGGHIKPHTDDPRKIITLVVSILRPGEWNPESGGGTDILKPRDVTRNFNLMNRQMEFDQVETIATFPFEPNQAVVFIKTFNSLHAVHPIRGHGDLMRKTLTINIERT